jgi:hypothetical protein
MSRDPSALDSGGSPKERATHDAGMTFGDVLVVCGQQRGFVEQYDRLTGSRFGALARRTPIEIEVDKASGAEGEEVAKFAAFVYEVVWTRLPRYSTHD